MQEAQDQFTLWAVVAPNGGQIAGQAAAFELDAPEGGNGLVAPNVGIVFSYGATGRPSRSAVLAGLRELFADARAFDRNRAAWEKNQYRPLAASHLDLEALQPVLDGQVPLLVHVARKADILAILDLAKTERIRVVLIGATEAWQVADTLARAQVPVVIDPVENAPESFDRLGARADSAALLERAGVTVLLSTFSTHNARKLRQWAGNAVREGMTHAGALRAVTAAPAQVFGLKRLGTLRPGQRADLVVWSGDPFEPLTQVERVLIGGRDISLRHRQRALAERYRLLPPAR
jgi:imidazolonepropionase-like amidohydrolase